MESYDRVFPDVPAIGCIQGVLLWGIMIASYLAFKKEKLVIRIKSPKGLSEEELKAVFANLKKQGKEDKFIQSMLKAREAELKIKNAEQNTPNIEVIDENKEEVNSNNN